MAKAAKKVFPLGDGGAALHTFLEQYQAEFMRESSTERGHVYWSGPVDQWILVMKKGGKAQVTFHHRDNCPCKML
jgi:hypothetical protein